MLNVTIADPDLDAFIRKCKRMPTSVKGELPRTMRRVTLKVEAGAKRHAPVWKGHLRRSITSEVRASGVSIQGVIGTNLPYARPIEEGRGAVTIRPRTAKFLRFEVGGQVIFARVVHQPPRKARPYLKRSVDENRAWMRGEFRKVIPTAWKTA